MIRISLFEGPEEFYHKLDKLDYGIDPANILCVAFTNKAAGEMKRRVCALIGEEYDTSLICTYHGFCVTMRRYRVR